MRKTLQGYQRAVRRRAFRRFWLGMMISRAGDAFTVVALSWVVLGIAGPAQLGLVLMCFGLPRIVSAPVAGRLLDRSRPRLLLVADNAARSRVAGARMTISSLGFLLGSAIGGVVIGGIGVPGVVLAIACSYLALGLLPLLAPALRTLDAPRRLTPGPAPGRGPGSFGT